MLNAHLRRLVRYAGLSSAQRFLQHIADGYCVKYGASVVALCVYAAPVYLMDPGARPSTGQLTADYIRSMRLLQVRTRGGVPLCSACCACSAMPATLLPSPPPHTPPPSRPPHTPHPGHPPRGG